MRAFTLDGFDEQPRLRDDLPEPRSGAGEVLVRVHTSSVNGVDVFIAAGGLKGMAEYEFPVTIGRDFAGVVEAVGADVSSYSVGDELFGYVPHVNPTVHDGSWAERIVVPQDDWGVPKPDSVDMAAAGAAPLAAITALAAYDSLSPKAGDRVLVVGATGGVGSFFVQLASATGAHVIAPALPEDEDYLRGLGVTDVIPRDERPEDVDAILDVVSQAPNTSGLKEGGRLASPLGAAGEGAGRFNLMAISTPANVRRVAELLDSGALRVPIQRSCPVEQAGEALQAFADSHRQGKLGVTIAS
jgi:NADPH:quinone reductase